MILPERLDARGDAEDRDLGLFQSSSGKGNGEGEQAGDERHGQERDDPELPREGAAETNQGLTDLEEDEADPEEEGGRAEPDPEERIRFLGRRGIRPRHDRHAG